ncbi:hypothetical protein Ocin01_09584 [Orchesella cincta]|uniref:Uncharacterized protein n=1 Tax=Orchesella cincta TaxID=48709 RepID=A0A1D2MVH8_ORCCI|nr:hypothetical protein Ocin01_09584 [Orchesella cincta]
MDQREARKYVSNNPPQDYSQSERRPSLLGRLLYRRTSSLSESENMAAGLQRRGSIEQPEAGSITQRVQTELVYNTGRRGSTAKEASIFT